SLSTSCNKVARYFIALGRGLPSTWITLAEHMKTLRIAVVSNYYPPHYICGYELGCRDVVESLKARGHEVRVLTSTYKVDRPQDDGEVYRWLVTLPPWEPTPTAGFLNLLRREITNRRAFVRFCRLFSPDLIYVWNPTGT